MTPRAKSALSVTAVVFIALFGAMAIVSMQWTLFCAAALIQGRHIIITRVGGEP